MRKTVLRIAAVTVGIFVAGEVLSGFNVIDWQTALMAAIVLGVLNLLVKPLLSILALPITLLTFGLFSFVINGALILLIGDLISGVEVLGLWDAILASVVISIISVVLNSILGVKK